MRMLKKTGWWHASERPNPSSTNRANDGRPFFGSMRGTLDFSAEECVRSWRMLAPSP